MTVKEIIINLLQNYEKLYIENEILKTMVSESKDSAVRALWETGLETLKNDPDLVREAGVKFAPLYAEISDEIDAAMALELLRKIPTITSTN